MSDGTALALREWGPEGRRGTVVLVHGLGEHIGRYEQVGAWFAARGFRVVGYDQRGHGQSPGPRGRLPANDTLLRDLEEIVGLARDADRPLLLLGHSMGGAVVARFVAEARQPVDFCVLSSPALAADLGVVQRLQLAIGERLAPDLAQGNGLDPHYISHDAAVVRAYIDDPSVHDRISARLARGILEAGRIALAAAPRWRVPTLLLYAGDDHLVASHGSDAFAASAPAEVVESERFDALYHEILNEGTLAAPVFARLERWLDARLPA
ncbi:MAG: lysophospholipase [Gemmatimonadaceae bacterium]|nr:lysophospholipase [Gemmatimonadaceae bacterium]